MVRLCNVKIQLVLDSGPEPPVPSWDHAQMIADAVVHLATRNIRVCLSASARGPLPICGVLRRLAPVLQEFDCAPMDHTLPSEEYCVVTPSHIRNLLAGGHNIRSLGLSNRMELHSYSCILPLVARLDKLERLEVDLTEPASLDPLRMLRHLKELHLKVQSDSNDGHGVSCAEALQGSASSLLHVSLMAPQWADATYSAVSQLPHLHTFAIDVDNLQLSNARVIAALRPSESLSVTVRKTDLLDDKAQSALLSGNAYMNCLDLQISSRITVINMYVDTADRLTCLSLTGMHLIRSCIEYQPMLQSLNLDLDRIGHAELELLVQSCPALESLSNRSDCGLQFSQEDFCVIFQLQHLKLLYVNSGSGPIAASLGWVEDYIRSQQCIGMAQAKVLIDLSSSTEPGIPVSVEYQRLPVRGVAEFDEEKPKIASKISTQVACVSKGLASKVKMFACEVRGRLPPRRVCSSKQVDTFHPLAMVMATAFVGIQSHCAKSNVSTQL